jgi:hypothetical protein
MNPQELGQLLAYGRELDGVEFKVACARDDKTKFPEIVRAVLAMSNRSGGGKIIIGKKEKDPQSRLGLDAKQLKSWADPDIVREAINEYADPPAQFTVETVQHGGATYIVLAVVEFADLPVLCRKDLSVAGKSQLVRGACYVRPRKKIASMPVCSQEDMRALLDLAIAKGLRRFVSTVERARIHVSIQDDPLDLPFFEREADEFRSSAEAKRVKELGVRGCWEIRIHPGDFDATRVLNVDWLAEILRSHHVTVRGIEFPRHGRDLAKRAANYVEHSMLLPHAQAVAWRLHKSGQFIQICQIETDWSLHFVRSLPRRWPIGAPRPPEVGTVLNVREVLWLMTEASEFAGKLATSRAGGPMMHIAVNVNGLEGRKLMLTGDDGVVPAETLMRTNVKTFGVKMRAEELLMDGMTKVVGRDLAMNIFQLFGWQPASDLLEGLQQPPR